LLSGALRYTESVAPWPSAESIGYARSTICRTAQLSTVGIEQEFVLTLVGPDDVDGIHEQLLAFIF
jgi:hypothetical protein